MLVTSFSRCRTDGQRCGGGGCSSLLVFTDSCSLVSPRLHTLKNMSTHLVRQRCHVAAANAEQHIHSVVNTMVSHDDVLTSN